jgi:demethylmenaquinone methyltransferase/2-methoxy-6-polyprenyl-1,4-benzoquinol methylase
MENKKHFDRIRKMFGSLSFMYDIEVSLGGLSENSRLRKKSVDSLKLIDGNAVLDICCGTGLNFKILKNRIGETGRIIGVDLTSKMLKIAKSRCDKQNWRDIELVNSNILDFKTETICDCAISTAAIGMIPEYDKAIDIVMDNLKKDGRFVIVDFKMSNRYPYKIFNYLYYKFAKTAGFDFKNRDLIEYIKSKYSVEFYEENMGGFGYIITFRKQ